MPGPEKPGPEDLEDPIWDGKPVTAWRVQILIVFQLWKHKAYHFLDYDGDV